MRARQYTEVSLRAIVARNLSWAFKETSPRRPYLLVLPKLKGTVK